MDKADISPLQKISTESLSDLNDELSAMIRAGIPLDEGLRSAAIHLRKDSRDFIERLVMRTEQGSTLAEAIDLESKELPVAYASLIKSGLRMGRLPEALTAYTSFSRSRIELRQEISNALLYPAFVLIVAFLLSLFVCFVIFPKLLVIHQMFQLETTPLLQYVYRLLEFYQIWYLIIPFAFCFLLFCWKSSRSLFLVPRDQTRSFGGKISSTVAYSWIPGYRNLIQEMNYSTFSEMTSLLLSYDVPLTEAFTLAAESTGSSKVIADAKSLTNLLEQGASLEEGIQSCHHFPVFMKTMIMKKNYHNHLPNILSEISRVYRTRILNRIDWLKNIIPVVLLIIVAGGITACYTIVVFLPFVEILKMLGSPTL